MSESISRIIRMPGRPMLLIGNAKQRRVYLRKWYRKFDNYGLEIKKRKRK